MINFGEKQGWTIEEFRNVYGLGRNKALEIVHMKGFPACRFGRRIVILADKVGYFMEHMAPRLNIKINNAYCEEINSQNSIPGEVE